MSEQRQPLVSKGSAARSLQSGGDERFAAPRQLPASSWGVWQAGWRNRTGSPDSSERPS